MTTDDGRLTAEAPRNDNNRGQSLARPRLSLAENQNETSTSVTDPEQNNREGAGPRTTCLSYPRPSA